MNTQKQITLMVALVFALIGGCAAYTVYDQNRENSALAAQQSVLAERGARIFARYCRQCHGNAGEGRIGPALNRDDLRDPTKLADTRLWVTDTITCGRIGKIMPPWAIREGGALNDEQIKDLVTLITTNAGNGWQKAGEFSAAENQAASVPPVDQVLAGAAITGATVRVCGQMAAATETPAAATVPAGLAAKNTWDEVATDNKFSVTQMAITAGTPATVNFANQGQAIHNYEVLGPDGKVVKDASGKDISINPLVDPGKSASISFTIATPGVYKFQCQVHPADMVGQLFVLDANGQLPTPTPGPAAAVPTPSTTLQETTTDNKFSATTLASPAGQQVTLTLDNKGAALHNFDITDVKDDSGKEIKTADFVQPNSSAKITFTISKPGTYHFRCDVHPTEMTGTIVIQ